MERQPQFPAFIRYAGEDEITLVSDREKWEMDLDFHVDEYDMEDFLVDASGFKFRFVRQGTGGKREQFGFQATGESLEVDRIRKWMVVALDEIQDRGRRINAKSTLFETECLVEIYGIMGAAGI